jgi:asparagine synthase (glutamine-hydrolysing)
LARDRFGIKPLYYSETGKRLRFASFLPALLKAGDVDTEIDREALHNYMTFHAVVPPPRTIMKGVRKLPPATTRTITADGAIAPTASTGRRLISAVAEDTGFGRNDWRDRVHDALRLAVRRRMVADVPVGVLLSGGVDSSLIVGFWPKRARRT